MRTQRHFAVERFLKVADAAALKVSGMRFHEYMRIDLSEFLDIAYGDKFTVADIDEGTACIAANEWDQSNFVMSMER